MIICLQILTSDNSFFLRQVKVVCETRGPDHLEELRAVIANAYREWDFTREFNEGPRRSSLDSLDDVSH